MADQTVDGRKLFGQDKRREKNALKNCIRYQPIRLYGLQDGCDSDWFIFKASSFCSMTVHT